MRADGFPQSKPANEDVWTEKEFHRRQAFRDGSHEFRFRDIAWVVYCSYRNHSPET
ncbi:hypothetical protein GMORB2_5338 [Geosmithia morbida]|uniref:Uncharacterized protein n=1 Tax=Geosmithia morbida TaxID=1094350 RepID=A0A9P4YZK2_9HYPO|nr:uncharacterized protein GMORB2_5338 [Geosmithia morbida]KAF4124672.1 hypothetical protein GMORB2_5338 [Geosmithia morbida]